MIDPNHYTIQHIELEVADLDIDGNLKDVILETLKRYTELKNRIAELEKKSPIKFGRVGDIHIGGEILPEFISDKWCKQCGAPVPSVHLKTCPTLKSRL